MSSLEKLDMSHHSLNKSSSKQKFTFSKANRFLPALRPTCDQSYYNLPTTRQRRSASFGVGEKTEMAMNKKDVPPPNRYKIEGEFQHIVLNKKRGFSFGYGREEVVGGPLSDTRRARPVPQLLNVADSLYHNQVETTRHQFKSVIEGNLGVRQIPGPGAYNPPSAISAKGNYILSNFKNCVFKTILPEGSRHNLRIKSPGPGQCIKHFNQDESKGTTMDAQGLLVNNHDPVWLQKNPVKFRDPVHSNVLIERSGIFSEFS